MSNVQQQTPSVRRFRFGENWRQFVGTVGKEQIASAEQSLKDLTRLTELKGKRFIDVGFGSGLLSLAARWLGAEVLSFDSDPESVASARSLKTRYCPNDDKWQWLSVRSCETGGCDGILPGERPPRANAQYMSEQAWMQRIRVSKKQRVIRQDFRHREKRLVHFCRV